jgi:uncharacterized protein
MSKKAGRNDPCPCGSGKKYKSCCWGKELPQSDATKKPLFGRIQSATSTSAIKKTFAAKVLKSGGPQDLVEKTFADSLDQSRHEELPPAPPSEELPPQELPKNYTQWNPPKNN